MLRKLLRYDLARLLRLLSVFYVLAVFFGLLTRLVGTIGDSLGLAIIKGILNGTAISMMCSALINSFMRSWVQFRSSLYGDESYLTHTLPVKKKTLYDSKFLMAAIGLAISILVVIAVLFIMYWKDGTWEVLKALFIPVTAMIDLPLSFLLPAFIILIFVEFLNGLQCGYFGIIMGHRENKNKILFSVIYGFAAYLAFQSITLVVVLLVGLINPEVMKIFTETNQAALSTDVVRMVCVIGTLLYLMDCLVLFFVNRALLAKGVNVD